MFPLVLKNFQAPGDALVMTAVLRDLHLNYPGKFQTAVETAYPEVFENNPYVTQMKREDSIPVCEFEYGGYLKNAYRTGQHFISSFHAILAEFIGLPIEMTTIYPELYVTDDEVEHVKKKFAIDYPFWLFNAGCKIDMPIKAYPPMLWESILLNLKGVGVRCIQVGHDHHIHPEFSEDRVHLNLVGKTNDLREYFALVKLSQGHIGAVSLQMHVTAALRKPCIVLAGGREDFRWEAYPNHQFMHTIGQLPCCMDRGCWIRQRQECRNMLGNMPYPACLSMIRPDEVVQKVLNYDRVSELSD
jgi:ADP-heptose:LPS heptosyltransferase